MVAVASVCCFRFVNFVDCSDHSCCLDYGDCGRPDDACHDHYRTIVGVRCYAGFDALAFSHSTGHRGLDRCDGKAFLCFSTIVTWSTTSCSGLLAAPASSRALLFGGGPLRMCSSTAAFTPTRCQHLRWSLGQRELVLAVCGRWSGARLVEGLD